MKKLFLIFIIVSSNLILPQTNDECFDCHYDEELTYERNNKEKSLYVSSKIFDKSAHSNVECSACHQNYDIEDIPHKEGNNIYKVDCANCHKNISNQYKTDIHHRIKSDANNEKPTCLSCHSFHNTRKISEIKNVEEYFCSNCHEDNKTATGFHERKYFSLETCNECHEDSDDYQSKLELSVHKKLECVDCHVNIADNIEEHEEGLDGTNIDGCALCHKDVVEIHGKSIHYIKSKEGIEDAANCSSCHGSHEILAKDNPQSMVNPKNLATTCGDCHDDPMFEEKYDMSVSFPGKMYSSSVHGKHVTAGDTTAANCSTCHGVHDIKNRVQVGSKISPINLPNTCIDCHEKEVMAYKNSIHWKRVQRGIKDSPVCNDCHNEHSVVEISEEGRESSRLLMQRETCIGCHIDSRVAKKYGKKGNQVEEYLNSYHGLAASKGDEDAALCVDCHNVHSILPSKDSLASTHPNNVTETCRNCHEDATEVFAKSYSHKTESESARNVEDIVSNIYFWLIVTVIGGMVLHNLIIFIFEARRKRLKEKNAIRMPRFTKNEVVQHILLATSFIILAITGFALKYPESFWAEGLRTLGMNETIRQYTHRVSAVIMIVLSLYHVAYLAFTKRGRDVLVEMLPTFNDLINVRENLSYYLGLSKKPPKFDMYDYAEKAEYWALIWGTFVMGVTGFFLWFPTTVGDWAPIWLIKVSEIIHFMEAILASLAILVWHWFFVIFRPSEYPMSFAWTDGKMTLEHYRHHHERHFRRIIIERYEYNNEKHPRKKLTNYTQLFIKTLEKSGFKIDRIIQGELNKDLELRAWFEAETTKIDNQNQ